MRDANLDRTLAIHAKAPLIDLHADTFSMSKDSPRFVEGSLETNLDLPRMFEVGLWAEAFSLFVYPKWGDEIPEKWREIAHRQLIGIESAITNSGGKLRLARNSTELLENRNNGAVSAIIEVEGLHSLCGNLDDIDLLFNRGVRIFTLTWNNSNDWATSCMDHSANSKGINEIGKEAIHKIDALGGLIDFSHSGEKTFWETLEIIEKPPICTHSCCMSLQSSPRNLTDEQIGAIIDKQGIIGVNFYPGFLSPKDKSEVTSADIVDHIEHIISLGGEDNVGLGSDFDGVSHLPMDITDCRGLVNITRQMIIRGFDDDVILRVLGGNFLRIFQ